MCSSDLKTAYAKLRDYSCVFTRQERVNGVLGAEQVAEMKCRTKPFSMAIRFAKPEASDEEVEAAARAAHVDVFADALPDGMETAIGENGHGLSGGQAQRIAIARAFLKGAPILLLDEPTAHLDPVTEADVLDSLRRLAVGRTTLIGRAHV